MFNFCPKDGIKLSSFSARTSNVGTEPMTWEVTGWKLCKTCNSMYALFEDGFGDPVDNGSPALVLVSSSRQLKSKEETVGELGDQSALRRGIADLDNYLEEGVEREKRRRNS